jgi:hypothetical protein
MASFEWKSADGKSFWEDNFGTEGSVDKAVLIEKMEQFYLGGEVEFPAFIESIVDFAIGKCCL